MAEFTPQPDKEIPPFAPLTPGPGTTVSQTADSETVALGGNQFETTVHSAPVRYQDEGGSWHDIDNSLVPDDTPGYSLTERANSYAVHLPHDLAANPVLVERDGRVISFALRGATGHPTSAAESASYPGALSGADVTLRAEPDSVKEAILLHRSAGSSFVYDVSASQGLSPVMSESGGIDFNDASGETAFAFAAPFVYDSSEVPAVDPSAAYSLAQDGAGWIVTLSIDPEWLQDSGRVFPVVVDPSVLFTSTDVAPNKNCYIVDGSSANTNFCGSGFTSMKLGYDGTKNYRLLLHFPLGSSGIPNNVQVLNAQLQLYATARTNSTQFESRVKELIQDFTEGQATWNDASSGHAWVDVGGASNPGAAVSTVPTSYTKSNTASCVNCWAKWYPTQLVGKWLQQGTDDNSSVDSTTGFQNNDDPNFGMVIRQPTPATTNLVTYNTDHAASNTPVLTVRWSPWLGDQSWYTMWSRPFGDRMQVEANVANANLVLHSNDLKIAGLGLDLQVGRWYNSLNAVSNGSIGDGWTLGVGQDLGLYILPDDSAVFYGPGMTEQVFIMKDDGSGDFTVATGSRSKLEKNGNGTYTLTKHQSDEKWQFGTGGALTSIEDKNGNTISFSYNGNGTLNTITDTRGRTTSFSYTTNGTGPLVTMTDPTSRTYKYQQNSSGQLVTYTDPDNKVWTYAYPSTSNNFVSSVTGPLDNVSVQHYVNFDVGSTTGRVSKIAFQTTTSTSCSSGTVYGFAWTGSTRFDNGSMVETSPKPTGQASCPTTTYSWDNQARVWKTHDANGNDRSTSYTIDQNPSNLTNADANHAVSLTWGGSCGSSENLCSVDNGGGGTSFNSATFAYGDSGHAFFPTSMTNAGAQYTYEYDHTTDPNPGPGNLNLVHYGASGANTETICYVGNGCSTGAKNGSAGSDGLVNKVIDANGNATQFGYNGSGELTSITPPASSSAQASSYTYDSLSRVSTFTDGNGKTTTFTYDVFDRITQLSYSDSTTSTTYTYDAYGNKLTRVDSAGTTTFTYDAQNQMLTKTTVHSVVFTYTYDIAGDLATLQEGSGGPTITYTYTPVYLVASVTDPSSATATSFTYDTHNYRTNTSYPNGVTMPVTYNNAGQITQIKGLDSSLAVLYKLDYEYHDGSGNAQQLLSKVTENSGNYTTYSYNAFSALTDAHQKTSGGTTIDHWAYDYDAVGNITHSSRNSTHTYYAYSPANELCWTRATTFTATCTYGGANTTPTGNPSLPGSITTYKYDGNGNLLSNSAGLALVYNIKNQTTSMTPPGGSAVSMSYADTDQTERVSAGPHTYESTQLGLDSDTVSSTTTRFTRDPGGIPIDERTSSATYYYLLDAQGSIVGLSDSSGGAIAGGTFTYDPFGAVTSSNTGAAASNPLRYTGGFADAHSGGPFSGNFGYTKLGTRYLESGLQRWTQVDPVTGQIGHPVTRNGYLYVQDNPANMTDSTGRFSPCTSSWLDVGLDAWGFISSGVAFAASFGLASPPLFIESLAFFAWNTANFELDVQEVEANC